MKPAVYLQRVVNK